MCQALGLVPSAIKVSETPDQVLQVGRIEAMIDSAIASSESNHWTKPPSWLMKLGCKNWMGLRRVFGKRIPSILNHTSKGIMAIKNTQLSCNRVKNIILDLLEMKLERIVEEGQCCPFAINKNLWIYFYLRAFKF